MTRTLVNWLIARAKRTPYFHLQHADGSEYMGRWWLVPYQYGHPLDCWRNPLGWLLQQFGIAVRVHHIATPDLDRALHDHPWDFISVVLRGGYLEARPVTISPCFDFTADPQMYPGRVCYAGPGGEAVTHTERLAGSIGYRRATDRHRIVAVRPDTYTLFITFRKVQWWGFYTPMGKVYYRDYASAHNKEPVQ